MDKKQLLQKLKALAEQGIGGEKENAQKKLNELMKKFDISEEDISDELEQEYEFSYKGNREKALLRQIIYKVTDKKNNFYGFVYTDSGRACKTKIGCKITKAQKIEIEYLFDFYKKLYQKEEKLFFDAFIQKHQLFGTLKDGEKPTKISLEELARLQAMAFAMSNEQPLKQIEFKQ